MSTLRNSLTSGSIAFYDTFVIHRWYVDDTYHQRFCRYTPVTLLIQSCYGAMIQHWYSIMSISQSDYRYTTDTLPIHYRYATDTDTLLIRYWYTTDTNQWYRDIHGISISHVLVHQNYNGKIKGKGKVYRKKWRSLRTRAHGVVSLAWLRSVVHACLPKAVEHMEQQQRYSQDTLRDAYRRVSWV